MSVPDAELLWSEDARVREQAAREAIAALEDDPRAGIALLTAISGIERQRDWPCETLMAVMTKLEALAEHDQYLALLLMLYLSRPASRTSGCYDVFDAIGLWVASCKNARVSHFLATHPAFAQTLATYVKPTS